MSDKTFLRITNKDIYVKLESIEKRIGKINIKVNVNAAVIGVIILIVAAVITRII